MFLFIEFVDRVNVIREVTLFGQFWILGGATQELIRSQVDGSDRAGRHVIRRREFLDLHDFQCSIFGNRSIVDRRDVHGQRASHATEVVDQHASGWIVSLPVVRHGDFVEGITIGIGTWC